MSGTPPRGSSSLSVPPARAPPLPSTSGRLLADCLWARTVSGGHCRGVENNRSSAQGHSAWNPTSTSRA
eukprot:25692-Chlamydomonas_euryale.AAC.3